MQSIFRARTRSALGVDFAGVVEAVGDDVTAFQAGDHVFGVCDGAFAAYVCAPESDIALLPTAVDFAVAAAVPRAGLTALQGLRDCGQLGPGQKVLIIGASGRVGTFAVQIARHLGAPATGVCGTNDVELVRSLGADDVIDDTAQDFVDGGSRFDVIFQPGDMYSPSHCRRALTRDGTLVLTSSDRDGMWNRETTADALSPFVNQRLAVLEVQRSGADLKTLAALIDAGALRPVIDRKCSLADVPDTVRYIERGNARGNVLVSVQAIG